MTASTQDECCWDKRLFRARGFAEECEEPRVKARNESATCCRSPLPKGREEASSCTDAIHKQVPILSQHINSPNYLGLS